MTPEQRDACLQGAASHVRDVEALGERADGYFDETYPATVESFLQAMLRETWRDDHGDTRRWDRNARAGGVYTIGRVVL